MSTLHKQRFSYRTPLQEPKEYWHLVPLKWNEINKSVYLDHIGMDNICSPRCLELLHDRSSPLEIKMFLISEHQCWKSRCVQETKPQDPR